MFEIQQDWDLQRLKPSSIQHSMQRLPGPLPPPPVRSSAQKLYQQSRQVGTWSYNAPILHVNYCKIFFQTKKSLEAPRGIFLNPGFLFHHGLKKGVPAKSSLGYGSKLGTPKLWMVNTKLDIHICGPLGLPF